MTQKGTCKRQKAKNNQFDRKPDGDRKPDSYPMSSMANFIPRFHGDPVSPSMAGSLPTP